MEIKKGQRFRCIKDVVMDIGGVGYHKGFTYTSAIDGCITDDYGNDGHMWDDSTMFWEHFELYDPVGSEEESFSFQDIANGLADLLTYKNKMYGNSALNSINVFAGKCKVGQRVDDKISRIQNSEELRFNDIADLAGYLFLIIKEKGWTDFEQFKD